MRYRSRFMTIYNNKGVLYTPFVSRCSSGGGWDVISQLGFASVVNVFVESLGIVKRLK